MLKKQKLLFGLFGFFLMFGGLILLTQQAQKEQYIRKKAAASSVPFIAFSTSTQNEISRSVSNNSSFDVPIYVWPGGSLEIVGVDVVVSFNPAKLQLTNIVPEAGTSFKTFLPANNNGVFDKALVLNQAHQTGKIKFSAIAFDGKKIIAGHKTQFKLATLRFKGIKEGTAKVNFIATKSNGIALTTDTNLAAAGKENDVLDQVQRLTITVNSPPIVPLRGDLNQDGVVNILDLDVILEEFGKSGSPGFSLADMDNDGQVTIFDFNIWTEIFNKS